MHEVHGVLACSREEEGGMSVTPGLVGRYVSIKVKRGDVTAREVCEVIACTAREHGGWRILVATHDGSILEHNDYRTMKLVAQSYSNPGGPYR